MEAPAEILAWLRKAHAPSGGRETVEVRQVPTGMGGTTATVQAMIQAAVTCSHHPPTKWLANRIVARVPDFDYEGEAEAIYEWVRDCTRYTKDPRGLEWVQGPCWTAWVEGCGDCDDGTTLVLALALANGMGARIRTVAADPRRPNEMSHVYPLIGIRGPEGPKWIAADVATRQAYFGWEPDPGQVFGAKDWEIASP